ncbi:MAG: zinc-dependent alcohol dehydrogenase [Ruminococcus sp.]|jgi:L-iditol 2-dehydrogenase
MLSVLCTKKGQLKNINGKIPFPEENELLIKIHQCGICGSDIQIYHGQHPYAKKPLVMGHECIAEVVKTGKNVKNVIKGDWITVQPQVFCGECPECNSGHTNVCENMKFMGVHIDGFFSEYAVVPEWNAIKLDNSENSDAAMLTEPAAVAVNASRRAGIQPGMYVVVIGAGTIGNLTAQVCRQMGAKVLITDIQDSKLDFAKKCDIDYCINTSDMDLKQGIKKGFGEKQADLIIDCAAVSGVFGQMVQCAMGGSKIVLVGNYKKEVTIDLSKIQRKEIDIRGVMQYNRNDFVGAIQLLKHRHIKTEGMISERFSLENLGKAFTYIEEHPEVMKVAIMME